MAHIELEDLFKIAKRISCHYQFFLKEGITKENICKLKELLHYEQFLYDFIEPEDYQKYCVELQKNFQKNKSSIYVNMCEGSFACEKRVLWHFLVSKQRKTLKEETLFFDDAELRFQYGCYFEFFNYLQNMYQACMLENSGFKPYLYKSLLSLSYIYPYLEQGYLLDNKKYQYFCKQDFETILNVHHFSSLKDQLYLDSLVMFTNGFKDINPIVFQNNLSGNVTRVLIKIYFYSMLYMIDERESVDSLSLYANTFMSSLSEEKKQFLSQMFEMGQKLYLRRNDFLEIQEQYLKLER